MLRAVASRVPRIPVFVLCSRLPGSSEAVDDRPLCERGGASGGARALGRRVCAGEHPRSGGQVTSSETVDPDGHRVVLDIWAIAVTIRRQPVGRLRWRPGDHPRRRCRTTGLPRKDSSGRERPALLQSRRVERRSSCLRSLLTDVRARLGKPAQRFFRTRSARRRVAFMVGCELSLTRTVNR
jgi:hypothetical protein